MRQEYELFKQEYSEQISEAGVNEHDICDAIILLFKDQYVGYQDREGLVRSKVECHVERLMIRKGNYDMTNYFLSELGLSSTP
jgi:glutaminase